MSTTAPEYLTTLRDGMNEAMRQWVDQSSTAWDQWTRAWTPVAEAGATALGMPRAREGANTRREGRHHHEKDCGCRECGCCRDTCDCCVPDADVVLTMRAGEVRVVPFRLRNPWRRERPVTIEVGPWHGCDGDGLEVRARLEETELVLRPCEDRVVRLLVTARGTAQDDAKEAEGREADAKETKATRATKAEQAQPTDVRVVREGGDVDSCASAYADVRFEGCARPQRVAVVVLPADCDPVDVACDCGCCC